MNIFQRFLSWLLSFNLSRKIFGKKTVIEIKTKLSIPILCKVCKKEPSVVDLFECPYCGNFHCKKHRVPEEHGCPNPKKPRELTAGRIIYRRGKVVYLRE